MRARVQDGDAHASALLDASAHPDAAASCVKPSVCIPIARQTTLLHRATRCEADEEYLNVMLLNIIISSWQHRSGIRPDGSYDASNEARASDDYP